MVFVHALERAMSSSMRSEVVKAQPEIAHVHLPEKHRSEDRITAFSIFMEGVAKLKTADRARSFVFYRDGTEKKTAGLAAKGGVF